MQYFPQLLDLFGEVPVTIADVDAWLRAVPRIEPDSPRAAWYVAAWSVPDKIRAAKRRGDFDSIVNSTPESPFWWKRLRWTGCNGR